MCFEKRAERAQAFKADVEADVGHAPVGVLEEKLSVLEPPSGHELMGRFTEDPFEQPQQVVRRQLGGFGNPGEGWWVLKSSPR